ncbi:Hypothetical predicted protein [Pelobates cultripes]|uniref:Uncharacterized protein n=1 Tax=Pelobates cultripes TaxID=61616 RepID=A0AAD1SM55_PELCU|nr:Hypothetical predicted protein [Pelobates cultripes]
MEALEQFLSGDEESQFSVTTAKLETLMQLLCDEVETERVLLRRNQAELTELEADTLKRSSERESFVSRMAQTINLRELLEEEAETKRQLDRILQELEILHKGSDTGSSEAAAEDILEKLEVNTDNAIASLTEKETHLLQQKEQLLKLMETTQKALAECKLKEQKAQEKLCEAVQGSSKCSQQREADRLLDTCIKEMGLLHILSNKKK